MTLPLFVVTGEDMALLEAYQIDSVWSALGLIVKARAKAERRAGLAVAPTPQPEPIADPPTPAVAIEASIPPAEEIAPTPPPPATPARRATVPLSETTVICDPGCGLAVPQAGIGAHRRECAAVLAFKEERGVRIVPDLLGSAAPLPDVPASDFDAKRAAHAKEAAERTWQSNHEVETGSSYVARDVLPKLTERQEEVLGAIRQYGGMSAAAKARGWGYKALESVIRNLRQGGRLPSDIAAIIAANVSHPRGAKAAGPGRGNYVRSDEARKRMSDAQVESRRRRGLPVREDVAS